MQQDANEDADDKPYGTVLISPENRTVNLDDHTLWVSLVRP